MKEFFSEWKHQRVSTLNQQLSQISFINPIICNKSKFTVFTYMRKPVKVMMISKANNNIN